MSGAVIELERCSKWYGHVLGISEITWTVSGGVVGLLGPNGAGKSTLIKMITGLMRPSRGQVRVFGGDPWREGEVRARIGHCPEHEGVYPELSAREFVTAMAELAGLGRKAARAAAAASLERFGMGEAAGRRMRGFSKGMLQRTKLAQATVHQPELLVLDEPLTGVDPVGRAEIAEHIRRLGAAGTTVLVSSHVLHEVEAVTDEILVIYHGQVLAEGNLYKIRELIDSHPHRIRIECDRPRELAAAVATAEHIAQIHYERGAITILTREPDLAYDLIADVSLERALTIRSLTSPDNNLNAVFEYLTGGRR